MEKTIFLNEVLKIIESVDENGNAVPFDIEIREFSWQNKTGGKYKVYNDARLARNVRKKRREQSLKSKLLNDIKIRKNPNDYENFTRQIELPNGEIKTIHPLYIIKFNNITMVY